MNSQMSGQMVELLLDKSLSRFYPEGIQQRIIGQLLDTPVGQLRTAAQAKALQGLTEEPIDRCKKLLSRAWLLRQIDQLPARPKKQDLQPLLFEIVSQL